MSDACLDNEGLKQSMTEVSGAGKGAGAGAGNAGTGCPETRPRYYVWKGSDIMRR